MKIRVLILSIVLIPFYSLAAQTGTVKISVKEYQDKVYAAWLGQCIGNFVGLPHENQHIEKPGSDAFPLGYTGSINRMKEANGAFSDDDTDIEYMYLMAMEKYGIEPTYGQINESWLDHIKTRVWLANRAALAAMRFGYTPPVTGMKEYNPHWFQIDPQLVNEIWGITAPGMVQYASRKSDWFARITDDSWGIEPTIHYGAMFSAAFFESDIHKLIDIGTSALTKGSRFAQTVEDMKALYAKYPNDYYGYEWEEKKLIGLIGFHTGSMEEFGGWFRTLSVEYQDDNLNWKPVEGLKMIPALVNKDNTDIKPDFVEYLLAFKQVSTKAIRIIGEAGGGDHWFSGNKTPYFTSITELSVYEPLHHYSLLCNVICRTKKMNNSC